MFSWAPKTLQMVTAATKLKDTPWKKNYDKPRQRIKKTKTSLGRQRVCIVKAMVFPVVMYRCESWTIKKAERQRIDALSSCAGEDSWEFLGVCGDQASQPWRKSTLNVLWKDWCWSWRVGHDLVTEQQQQFSKLGISLMQLCYLSNRSTSDFAFYWLSQ